MLHRVTMSVSRRAFGLLLVSTGVASLVPRPSGATTLTSLDLVTLTKRSRTTVLGTPLERRAEWTEVSGTRRIVTLTRVELHDVWFDDERLPLGGQEVLVRTLGGRVGDLRQKAFGEAALTKGEAAVLFLGGPSARDGARPVVGMAQGHYPLVESGGITFLRPSTHLPKLVRTDASGSASAVETLSGLTLERARALVTGARP